MNKRILRHGCFTCSWNKGEDHGYPEKHYVVINAYTTGCLGHVLADNISDANKKIKDVINNEINQLSVLT